ncbi:hypothetical protein BGZ65_010125, partial [Modicella reniformis]
GLRSLQHLGTEITDQVEEYTVERAPKSRFEILVPKAYLSGSDQIPQELLAIPITRLAFSKDSTFLAALALCEDTAYLTVWDMDSIVDSDAVYIIYRHCAVAIVKHDKHENFDNFSIGLAISPNGDQVAIYQEPKIGQWMDDAKLPKSSFRIRLFKNLLARKSPQTPLSTNFSFCTNTEANMLEVQTICPQRFNSFVGYGTFLTQSEGNHWEMNNVNTVLFSSPDEHETGSNSGTQPRISTAGNTLFVACNGIYIDIFEAMPEKEWIHIRSIKLTDLVPTFNRRIMCKMMMETISSDTLMWLEDNGICCTLWDLQKGSNISYIFNTDNSKFSDSGFRGSCKMAISPEESIVALARDDTLTTYYASSGIEISARKFSGHKIEYIAFYGQSNQLFVVVRRTMSLKLDSWIIDPFQLKLQVKLNQVPIPIMGKTIFATFREGKSKNKGVIYEADGSKIRCYVSREPADTMVTDNDDNLVSSFYTSHPPKDKDQQESVRQGIRDEHRREYGKNNQEGCDEKPKRYTLRTKSRKESFPDGDDLKYWVTRVEVEESHEYKKVIFSFVPEPWMRVSTKDAGKPGDLMNV